MTTGAQNIAAAMGLSLALANMLNGPQRPALRGFITGPTSGQTGGGGSGGGGGGWGPGGIIPKDPFPYANPLAPDIPGIPQGPLSGIPFSPISVRTAGTGQLSPWRALLEVTAELAFIAGLVLIAEDYPAVVIAFLAILWLLFLMTNPHPWRSRTAAPIPAPATRPARATTKGAAARG